MSTKEWVSSHHEGASLYQEFFYDFEKHEVNPNPAVIQTASPKNFSITREEHVDGKHSLQLVVEIPADRFDEIAIAWCKKRKLHGAMGGPVGSEFGSPDSDYPQE
jgi:hypothetical protein